MTRWVHTSNGPIAHILNAAPRLFSGIRSAIVPPPSEREGHPERPMRNRKTISIERLELTAHATENMVKQMFDP